MTGIAQTSVANVEYTVNQWFGSQLAALSRPSCLPTMPALGFDYPEDVAALLPVFSFAHTPVDVKSVGQGNIADTDGTHGQWMRQFLWLGCWVSRSNVNWSWQLRSMQDMAITVFNTSSARLILDFNTSQSNPSTTSYKVQFIEATINSPSDDPNVDVRRRDIRILYQWVYRT